MQTTAGARALSRNQKAVLTVLTEAGEPLSAYQILGRSAPLGLTAPTQVYRALKLLCDRGLVHRLESLNAFVACHHAPHSEAVALLLCTACGRVAEVELEKTMEALTRAAGRSDFAIERAVVEAHGRCAACREAAPA